jgi:ABC-2 type transport system permease protein
MRNIWTIASREYKHYFISPIAYVVAFLFLSTVGIIFAFTILNANQSALYYPSAPDASSVTAPMAFLLLLAAPALTMRLLADEQRMGTMELLLTAPLRDWELVLGKWLGAFLFIVTLVGISLIFPLILEILVTPSGIDKGILFTGYLGVLLVAAAMLGLGVGISAMFSNQTAAFFVSLVIFVVMWWLIGVPASLLPNGGEVFRYLDMASHFYETMVRGQLVLADVVYYLSLTALGLFTGTIAVEIRRWQ